MTDAYKFKSGHGTAASETPVFALGVPETQEAADLLPLVEGRGLPLPAVFVSVPSAGAEGELSGRVEVGIYPDGDYPDEDGEDALYYGGGYYDEAMSYTDLADHGKRVDCFRAAELLYLHASARGNRIADLCLGYVYSYDRCEGDYWGCPMELGEIDAFRKRAAFRHLELAAEADIPEACYKLGDLYKRGTGCEPDAAEAFRWYLRASELSSGERPVVLGSVALRLAGCYEEGLGCQQDFARALGWYRRAVAGLDAAVGAGDAWYEKALASARAGVKRCEQEVGE